MTDLIRTQSTLEFQIEEWGDIWRQITGRKTKLVDTEESTIEVVTNEEDPYIYDLWFHILTTLTEARKAGEELPIHIYYPLAPKNIQRVLLKLDKDLKSENPASLQAYNLYQREHHSKRKVSATYAEARSNLLTKAHLNAGQQKRLQIADMLYAYTKDNFKLTYRTKNPIDNVRVELSSNEIIMLLCGIKNPHIIWGMMINNSQVKQYIFESPDPFNRFMAFMHIISERSDAGSYTLEQFEQCKDTALEWIRSRIIPSYEDALQRYPLVFESLNRSIDKVVANIKSRTES